MSLSGFEASSYGTDYDSDTGTDAEQTNNSSYHLNSPPAGAYSKAYFSKIVYNSFLFCFV